jgi:hypothetical protein
MQGVPSACLSTPPNAKCECKCDVVMQIPVKRPVSSCDPNPASLSRRALLCKTIYAAVKRGRSKQDSPLHGSLVPRPDRSQSDPKKRKGQAEEVREKEKQTCTEE